MKLVLALEFLLFSSLLIMSFSHYIHFLLALTILALFISDANKAGVFEKIKLSSEIPVTISYKSR